MGMISHHYPTGPEKSSPPWEGFFGQSDRLSNSCRQALRIRSTFGRAASSRCRAYGIVPGVADARVLESSVPPPAPPRPALRTGRILRNLHPRPAAAACGPLPGISPPCPAEKTERKSSTPAEIPRPSRTTAAFQRPVDTHPKRHHGQIGSLPADRRRSHRQRPARPLGAKTAPALRGDIIAHRIAPARAEENPATAKRSACAPGKRPATPVPARSASARPRPPGRRARSHSTRGIWASQPHRLCSCWPPSP